MLEFSPKLGSRWKDTIKQTQMRADGTVLEGNCSEEQADGQSVKLSMRKNRNVTITHDTKFEDSRIRQRSEKSDHCRKRVGERAPVIHFPAPLLSSRWRDTRDPGWSPPVVLQRSRHFSGFSATVPEWNPALPRSPELTTLSRPQPSVP